MINPYELDAFTRSFLETSLWAGLDDEEPLDKNHGIEDVSQECLEKIVADCAEFQKINKSLIKEEYYVGHKECTVEQMAGHDFALTRNHHGAGFWDGDWIEVEGVGSVGDILTETTHKFFKELDLYVVDGKIYC